MMRCRVVWALALMMLRRSPMSRFIRVDLPTLGDPMMFTKPERCGAFAFVWDTELGLDLQRKRSALSSPSRLREMHRGVEQW